jgi:CBS domain-containing protein
MRAKEMMNASVLVVQPSDSVAFAARAMRDERAGFVCVCDREQRPLGIVTDRDLATRVCAVDRSAGATQVRQVMSPNPVTCRLDSSVGDIGALMEETGVSRVLVVDERGALAGAVTLAELWHYESPLTAGAVSRRLTERQLRVQTNSAGRHPTSVRPR